MNILFCILVYIMCIVAYYACFITSLHLSIMHKMHEYPGQF